MSRHSYAAWENVAAVAVPLSNSTLTEPMGGSVSDVMRPNSRHLGPWATPQERGSEILVALGEECHVWAIQGGSECRTLHTVA